MGINIKSTPPKGTETLTYHEYKHFVKLNTDVLHKLMEELTSEQLRFFLHLCSHIGNTNNLVYLTTRTAATNGLLSNHLGIDVRMVRYYLNVLFKKDCILKQNGNIYINFYICQKGKIVDSTLKKYFNQTMWAIDKKGNHI